MHHKSLLREAFVFRVATSNRAAPLLRRGDVLRIFWALRTQEVVASPAGFWSTVHEPDKMREMIDFYNTNIIFIRHIELSVLVLVLSYFVVTRRRLLYVALALCLVNILLAVVPLVAHLMSGEGMSESVLYHVLHGLDKYDVLLEYRNVTYILASSAALVLALIYIATRLTVVQRHKLSATAQGIMIVAVNAGLMAGSPFVFEAVHLYQVSGLQYDDRVGLDRLLEESPTELALKREKKNLIVIYAESLEQAFFDTSKFPGLMPRLGELAEKGLVFDHLYQSPMSDWTIAGMVASQCGLPLSSHRRANDQTVNFSNFSSHSACLADFLKQNGYHLVFMGGADHQFAGKGEFYRSVGFDEIQGLNELVKTGEPVSKWGIYDDSLLPQVEQKIAELQKSAKPFAFIGLTLDSHPPEGFPSPSCATENIRYGDGKNVHLNTLRCTDELLSKSMKEIIEKNIHNSNIVLLSDHLMMPSLAKDAIADKGVERFNRMVIWSSDIIPGVNPRQGGLFDIASTLWQLQSGESVGVGFGHSLIDVEQKTLIETYGSNVVEESVKAWRVTSWSRW